MNTLNYILVAVILIFAGAFLSPPKSDVFELHKQSPTFEGNFDRS